MCDKNDSPSNSNKFYTPPPINKKVRNPFDRALIERLHKPICSPGMCKIYKKKCSGPFKWDIDQACTLVPADIVVCNSQFEPSPDPILERLAEEATEQFFSQEMVMPSPLESSKKVKPLQTSDTSIQVTSLFKETSVVMKDVSAQTVLTLPPELPPEVEKILQPFFTFKQEQNMSGEYEITANGSLCRKLFFEEHSDMEQYDSEQTDDEVVEQQPTPSFNDHSPVVISPDLSQNMVSKGMKRTFGTPLNKSSAQTKPCYRNKILDVVDFGEPTFSPIQFITPNKDQSSTNSSSMASISISPVMKVLASDEEKLTFTSPESDVMATCLDCISQPETEKKGPCYCKITPNKSYLRRSISLKESPPRSRKGSVSLSRSKSMSMSSLNRSKSVQKLDFSMDMSIDSSLHNQSQDSETNPPKNKQPAWSIVEETSIHQLVKAETLKGQSQSVDCKITVLDETPVKTKTKSNALSHEISKIRATVQFSSANMSLDNSIDSIDNPLSLEDKKIDFNSVDLKFLAENVSQFDYTNATKNAGDSSTSFKRVDSGFNENTTFYANASSYYESAIKPSELTITNTSKINSSKTVLKEISNVNWMRIDSGFKDENSADSMQFFPIEASKKISSLNYHAKMDEKENLTEDFMLRPNKNDAMSMSDIFTDDMTFNCNFSSTPSKNKSRKNPF